MRARLCTIFLFIISLSTIGQSNSLRLIVQLQKEKSVFDFENKWNRQHSETPCKKKEKLCDALNIWSVDFNINETDTTELLESIQNYSEVVAAQKIQKISYRTTTLNDPQFSLEWNLLNDGSFGGTADADTDADLAWDYGQGKLTNTGDSIVIAVVDAGFDINHEDLNFWKNKHEIPGDLVDNDLNGYVDDYAGWNIENGNSNTNTGTVSLYHATSVCGSAAAVGNNNLGIAGIAPQGLILPVHLGPVYADSVIKAYDYIIKMRERYNSSNGDSGAFVVAINSSFGISDSPNNNVVWCNLYDYMGSIGILNVTATNNIHLNYDVVDDVPGNCASNYIINTTYSNNKDEIGNCGYGKTNVDIAAPGYALFLTRPGNTYAAGTGTSFAAPQVSGAVAVLYSVSCDTFMTIVKNNPNIAAQKIKDFLMNSVDVKPDFQDQIVSNGRLNLYAAVKEMRSFCGEFTPVAPVTTELKILSVANYNEQFIVNYDIQNKGPYSLVIYDAIGKKIAQFDATELNSGNFTTLFDTSILSNGVYILQLENSTAKSNTIRVIKY